MQFGPFYHSLQGIQFPEPSAENVLAWIADNAPSARVTRLPYGRTRRRDIKIAVTIADISEATHFTMRWC